MNSTPAFTAPAAATTFTSARGATLSSSRSCQLRVTSRPARQAAVSMQFKLPNPFAAKPKRPDDQATSFMQPQAGDPGYTPLPPVPKGFGMEKTEPKSEDSATAVQATPGKAAQNLPVASGAPRVQAVKRGLDLLKEDFLKNAPERAGVGRQDQEAVTMKPVAGEPGYKPPSIATVKVSALGISPFPDDKNFVSNVGGIEAVKKAAVEAKAGKSAKQLKKEALQSLQNEPVAPVIPQMSAKSTLVPAPAAPAPVAMTPEDLLPDYLKPIPEDSPRKGMTWKNYDGR